MTRIERIRERIARYRADVLDLAEALDAIEKARAFINVGTVYTGTQDDATRLKAACEALDAFFKPETPLIAEPAEPTPEPKRVKLPVFVDQPNKQG